MLYFIILFLDYKIFSQLHITPAYLELNSIDVLYPVVIIDLVYIYHAQLLHQLKL